jgi:hypothetical protein
MTSSWFVPAFLVFLLFGLYIWTIGSAVFGGSRGIQDLFIELLDPAVEMAGGFRRTHGKKEVPQLERGRRMMGSP